MFMGAILANVGSLATSALGWMGSFLTSITSNDVLTLFVIALPLVGLGIGLLRRLIKSRA